MRLHKVFEISFILSILLFCFSLSSNAQDPITTPTIQGVGDKTSTFTGQGFDKCEIPTLSELQTWITDSPYKVVNLYIGGSRRACANSALTASYVSQLSQQGWKFIPTWVGPQCLYNEISDDLTTAYNQGIAEANAAVTVAANLGLTSPDSSGTIIYYDMEGYTDDYPNCSEPAKSFISGWTAQLHATGNLSGVYGSSCTATISAFAGISNIPDAVWPAAWYWPNGQGQYDPNASVWDVSCLNNSYWNNHQRIRQYAANIYETYGGVTLHIDSDVIDGIVADLQNQQQSGETLIAHFADGSYAVTSQQEYSGLVTITVSDIGQASGTQYSDAFYLLTDYIGNPIDPVHPTLLYNWVLWINGQHAENLIPGQQVPSYRGDHSYTFQINAPGGNLTFGVGDGYTADNTGSYTIHVNTSSDSIPYFSQRDPRWVNHALLCASGTCSSSCNTIGTCGSTLTSAAMLFASYGANLIPPALSDCMGTSAYPFDWSVGASCSNDHATWGNRYTFSWTQLDQELNQNGHPVLLGMHHNSDLNDTHWVLVTGGYGTDASNYLIHDPWPLDGAGTNLNVYARQGYVFDWISVYDNESVFGLVSQDTNQQDAFPVQTKMLPDQFQAIATATPDTAIEATPIPKAIDQTMPESSLSNSDTIIATSSAISGSILVYHVSETAVTIQLAATSTVGDITEMQVWTDSNPTSTWQVFDTFAWLPWMSGDQIYARFRDNLGNVSDIYSDSIRPISSPPSQIFLPIILKSQ